MTPKDIKHVLFTTVPAWGHTRPFCSFAARLYIDNYHAHSEIFAEFGEGVSENVRRRLRVLSTIPLTHTEINLDILKSFIETYATAYQDLSQAKSISCAVKGTVFDAVPAPVVVILDLQTTRAITGRSVPILCWQAGYVSSIIRYNFPERLGGVGDLGTKIDAEATRLGVTPEEIGDKLVLRDTDEKLFKAAGVPAMYGYEFSPQKVHWDFPFSAVIRGNHICLTESDAVIATTAYAFENESLNAMKSWYSEMEKEVYTVGPLLPHGYGTLTQSSRGAADIEAFLDKKLIQHAKHSVLFMSFGSAYWPSAPEYLEQVIEALVEKKFPFIFGFASPSAKLSDQLEEKVKSSGLGMLTQWAPQQFILSHPATGWFKFLTHCGQSSVMEGLATGIPLIAWPFEGDQPIAVAHLSENLNIAIELIEVRTGESGMRPLHRNGRAAKGTREAVGVEIRELLDACRGQKGEEMRQNAQDMKLKLGEAWREDRVSRQEFRMFLNKYLDIN